MTSPRSASRAARLRNGLAWLKGQVWLLPGIVSFFFFTLSVVVLRSEGIIAPGEDKPFWLYSGDAQTARDLLGNILTGLITLTSVVLSMTFVALTLAANQLGPRLVMIITSDRQIQTILGVFLGSIIYVLIVLRSLGGELGGGRVPHLAVTVASLIVFACLFALLLYVHKISRSIVADVVVERVSQDLNANLADTLEDAVDTAKAAKAGHSGRRHFRRAAWLSVGRAGYIQTMDYGALIEAARDADALLAVAVRPGHFLLRNGHHVEVHADAAVGEEIEKRIRDAFVIGSERSPAQDLEYSIRQLVESGTRALSPGIHDPFTAIAVIDKLAEAIEVLTGDHPLPSEHMRDEAGVVRVIANVSDLEGLVDAAFDQMRQSGGDNPAVLIHLADAIGKLMIATDRDEAHQVLNRHLDKVEETARAQVATAADLAACLERIEAARRGRPGWETNTSSTSAETG